MKKKFPIKNYKKGIPQYKQGKMIITPWDANSDMPFFAEEAAKSMHKTLDDPRPEDVYAFAFNLRRIMILEQLNLPTDPESVNFIRLIENIICMENKSVQHLSVAIIAEKMASFLLNLQTLLANGKTYDPEEMFGQAVFIKDSMNVAEKLAEQYKKQ